MRTLTCKYCSYEGPVSDFRKDPSSPGGYRPQCKPCRRRADASKKAPPVKQQAPKPKPVNPDVDAEYARRVSEARVSAIRKLIENHQREFKRLYDLELSHRQVQNKKSWQSLHALGEDDDREWDRFSSGSSSSLSTFT